MDGLEAPDLYYVLPKEILESDRVVCVAGCAVLGLGCVLSQPRKPHVSSVLLLARVVWLGRACDVPCLLVHIGRCMGSLLPPLLS